RLAGGRDHDVDESGAQYRAGVLTRVGAGALPRRRWKFLRPHLREEIEPGLGSFLGGVARFGRLLLREVVEEGVARAHRLEDEVPLDRLDRVGRADAASDREDAGKPVLRDRAATHRSLAEEADRAWLVFRD